MNEIESIFLNQEFGNGYQLVDGVVMREEHGDKFQIPPPVIKRQVTVGQFVELRIDSPRFSMHDEDAAECPCPSCNGDMSSPILCHEAPASLVEVPDRDIPSRGWGEDFWVQIVERQEGYFKARVDNDLCEARLHGVEHEKVIAFHEDHILAVHGIHRKEIVLGMDASELKELAQWLETQRKSE